MDGIIIKAYGGFYFVRVGERVLKCVIRGKIRRRYGQVLVGDRVLVTPDGVDAGVVEDVLPRVSELVRPPVANVDRAVIVFSVNHPQPNTMLLDRFLLQARVAGIEPVICMNKIDLANPGEPDLLQHYEPAGYPLAKVSARNGTNLDQLRELLKGRVSVLAGPSGVGKSSLLNALQPGLALKTGEISRKLKRGRHTTRHVELIPLADGGLVVDTPGFSSMYLPPLRREELAGYYPEFEVHAKQCRFTGCLHYREPECAVKEAVANGLVSMLRYRQYLELLEEVMEAERRH